MHRGSAETTSVLHAVAEIGSALCAPTGVVARAAAWLRAVVAEAPGAARIGYCREALCATPCGVEEHAAVQVPVFKNSRAEEEDELSRWIVMPRRDAPSPCSAVSGLAAG